DSNSEKDLDRSFTYSANMKADWSKTFGLYSINANIIGRYISERYNNVYSYYYPAYGLIDLNTNHTFRLKDFDLTAGLGIENLLDYKDDRPYNARKPYTAVTPGRTLYANLVIRFRK
ncbi:MAG: TonB-dependent receptor, partial [Bacteroides sp.]|nr:TonB-dependent receptor [Bacteroides sp.]